MKNTTNHTGILEIIERAPSSRNGNPRYVVRLDGITCRTAVDSSLGYLITNYDGKMVSADIGTYRGTVTIENVRQIDAAETKFETGAKTARANDIILAVINDGDGSQCGLPYLKRRTATLPRIREACRHYAPSASSADIYDAARLIAEYYANQNEEN